MINRIPFWDSPPRHTLLHEWSLVMGSTLNNLQVMETRCNHERSSIAHLRELPPGMFDLVVKRIAKGDPLTQIAKSLHTIQPDFAEETFRKWLHDLAK
jgi:hypothetical protein